MSSVAKAVSTKLDWTKVITSLGLTGSTAASLTAFKKRHDEAKKESLALAQQPTEVDFAHYRSVLKNAKVVDEIEKAVAAFKPVTYDVSKNLKNIEVFEQKAIENAKLTEKSVLDEIAQLQTTLKDIESARPFDQLTVDDVAKARPDLDEKVTYMVKNGKWEVPGYKEKFGDLTVM
ncbi:ATP synthase d subunit [Scheffersomyces xylosifermentans]|uniref:ATP synthase d subunit n=1 Tax=Scheffersomyces xylosifermentans TaxID=1304137 RepID=UPI00315D248C